MGIVTLIKSSPLIVKFGLGAGSLIGAGSIGWKARPVGDGIFGLGKVVIEKTGDAQWRFMYLLAGKVFDYFKSKEDIKSQIGIETNFNLVNWLSSRFKKTTYLSDWKGFKDLCHKQMKDDGESTYLVKVYESRFCFMGKWYEDKDIKSHEDIIMKLLTWKGNLRFLTIDEKNNNENTSPYKDQEPFKESWEMSNYDLWKNFIGDKGSAVKDDVNHSEWDSKFSEWFEDTNTKVKQNNSPKTIKNALSVSGSN